MTDQWLEMVDLIKTADGENTAANRAVTDWASKNPSPPQPKYESIDQTPAMVIEHSKGKFWLDVVDGHNWRDAPTIRLEITLGEEAKIVSLSLRHLKILKAEVDRALSHYDELAAHKRFFATVWNEWDNARNAWESAKSEVGAKARKLWNKLKRQKKLVKEEDLDES